MENFYKETHRVFWSVLPQGRQSVNRGAQSYDSWRLRRLVWQPEKNEPYCENPCCLTQEFIAWVDPVVNFQQAIASERENINQ